MTTSAAHYENLLARHYTWMLGGDLEAAAGRERQVLEDLGVRAGKVAVDLGCGPGPQTLALADMGFETVIGVDTSQELLDELAEHARSRPAVRALNMDLVQALPDVAEGEPADVVVCMRDTVLHLPDRDAVVELAGRVASSLAADGAFVLTYRDLTTPLQGLDRFMPVRSDSERIMLCALDYQDPEIVTVNDLVYTRGPGRLELHKSSYPKLRLSRLAARPAHRGRADGSPAPRRRRRRHVVDRRQIGDLIAYLSRW